MTKPEKWGLLLFIIGTVAWRQTNDGRDVFLTVCIVLSAFLFLWGGEVKSESRYERKKEIDRE